MSYTCFMKVLIVDVLGFLYFVSSNVMTILSIIHVCYLNEKSFLLLEFSVLVGFH